MKTRKHTIIQALLTLLMLFTTGCSVLDYLPIGRQAAAPSLTPSPTTADSPTPVETPTITLTPSITPVPSDTVKPTLRPTWTVLPTTLIPTWTPSKTVSPTATPEVGIILQEDFSDQKGGWMFEKTDNYLLSYSHGGYMIGIYAPYVEAGVSRPWLKMSETRIEVDVKRMTGKGYYGVACRDTGSSNYSLVIDSEGYAGIMSTRKTQIERVVWVKTEAVKTERRVNNRVRGECRGNTLTLWVNDVLVAHKTLPGPGVGWVGLVAGTTVENDKVEAVFDNLVIWGPVYFYGYTPTPTQD